MPSPSEFFPSPATVPLTGLRVAAAAEAGRLAAEGPRRDDYEAMFALADRRRRTHSCLARDLLLAAQALRALGRFDAARHELDAALALDPADLALDRAALAWGGASARRQAASRIVGQKHIDAPLRAQAVAALLEGGAGVVQQWRRVPLGIAGWLAWPGAHKLELEFEADGATQVFLVDPDADHPLASGGIAAAQVEIETLSAGPITLRPRALGSAAVRLPDQAPPPPAPAPSHDLALTIVIPVYEDYPATHACLEALRRTPPRAPHRIVVVDDACPDAKIRAYLDQAAADGAFLLIRNGENLGFAASVNRALATRSSGDVLLLNADTLAPPGAIDRLAALSRAAPDVGALTPFSNNGELTSYPVRHEANPLPEADEIAALDATAQRVNGDALVDLPNGIGFCLYITQDCLAAVGPLPEVYGRGYFEDVEFCLRARERGFRTVAAPGVFVGHAGSRSFGEGKAPLVARNLKRIEMRFPGFQLESAAFVALDPLKPYRAALDRAAPPPGAVVLVACGPRAAARLGRRRAAEIAQLGPAEIVLLLVVDLQGRLQISRMNGGAPQSLTFDAPTQAVAYLEQLDLKRLECLDPASLPDEILAALIARDAEFVLLCGDLAWFAPPPSPPEGPCIALNTEGPCDVCRALSLPGPESRRVKLGRALERTARIVPLDRLADSFASRVFKARASAFEAPAPPALAPTRKSRIGVLYPHPAPLIDRLLRRLGGGEGPEFVVFGQSLDDRALMACGRVFVVGPINLEDYAETARRYRIDALLGPDRGGGFGDLEAAAAEIGVSKAYFDWSFGGLAPARGDLSLDPRICDEKAAARIDAWARAEEPASL